MNIDNGRDSRESLLLALFFAATERRIRMDKFSALKLFENQTKILLKYEKVEDIYLTEGYISQKQFIALLDRYMMHLLEEVGEVNEETTAERIEDETIDVLLYLGTIGSIFTFNLDDLAIKSIVEIKPSLQSVMNFDLNREVVDYIRRIRKEYPHRKWHKSYDIHSRAEMRRILYKQTIETKILAERIFTHLCFNTSHIDLLVKKVGEKSNYVLDLETPR
jgi:NTP pyrophosphatase (non-canonical NTP hydrolase)